MELPTLSAGIPGVCKNDTVDLGQCEDIWMTKKPTAVAAGNSEAIRSYERMEEERQQGAGQDGSE